MLNPQNIIRKRKMSTFAIIRVRSFCFSAAIRNLTVLNINNIFWRRKWRLFLSITLTYDVLRDRTSVLCKKVFFSKGLNWLYNIIVRLTRNSMLVIEMQNEQLLSSTEFKLKRFGNDFSILRHFEAFRFVRYNYYCWMDHILSRNFRVFFFK